jgi:hypothetical protein
VNFLQFCSALQKTIFLHCTLIPLPLYISIHISITAKLQKQKQKINQTIERVAFESFAVFFAVALQ